MVECQKSGKRNRLTFNRTVTGENSCSHHAVTDDFFIVFMKFDYFLFGIAG
jgi:hypothetical protein